MDGIHIGIHANGESGLNAAARRHGIDQRQLRFRLAIEAVNAAGQRVFDFAGGLAHAGEDHPRWVAAGLQHAKQFAAGNDVEARAGLRQQGENGQRGVGFYRIADGVRNTAEGVVICA